MKTVLEVLNEIDGQIAETTARLTALDAARRIIADIASAGAPTANGKTPAPEPAPPAPKEPQTRHGRVAASTVTEALIEVLDHQPRKVAEIADLSGLKKVSVQNGLYALERAAVAQKVGEGRAIGWRLTVAKPSRIHSNGKSVSEELDAQKAALGIAVKAKAEDE